VNFQFDENQQSILEVVEQFSQREIVPHIDEIDRNDHLPEGFHKKAGDAGILGLALPEDIGGLGQSFVTLMGAMAKIAEYCPGMVIALSTTMTSALRIIAYGSDAVKKRYLSSIVSGDLVGGMAFTEPGTGSDPKQLTATAAEDGDSFVLNGVKRFITNATYPGPLTVFAKDSDTGRCSAYIIDKLCEGYSLSSPWEKVGFRASPVYDVFLDNIRIPKDNLVGTRGDGFSILLSGSALGKVFHGATVLGLCEACKKLAIKYAREKVHRGQSITKFQAIQLLLAEICELTESVKWMLYRCAALADESIQSEEFKAYAALVKAHAADISPRVGMLAMNIFGAYAPMREYQIERYMRDAMTEPEVEVVPHVQRLIAANYYIKTVQ
jgi:alkylation response protein AidB-like acyl-CoA dehydrogenase